MKFYIWAALGQRKYHNRKSVTKASKSWDFYADHIRVYE